MTRRSSSLDNTTVGIQRDIGSEYDNVKRVADNLTIVSAVGSNINAVNTVNDNILDIQSASANAASAAVSASNAATSETNASVSEVNAGVSAANASTSETNSASSASAALTSETNASISETNAANSANAASISETNAELDRQYASEWANKAEDVLVSSAAGGDQIDDYSALHHANKASASAAAASNSANNAATSETNASNSASAASTSASNASTSESNAAASAASAAVDLAAIQTIYDNFDDRYLGQFAVAPTLDNDGSPLLIGALYYNTVDETVYFYGVGGWESPELSATEAATQASTSASNASTSEINAAASASAANTSAINAATSEANASTSASNAAASEANADADRIAAQSARDQAIAARDSAQTAEANVVSLYDNFDDRYLGAKASDPALDNDGDAIIEGAIYFNTTANEMLVYNGTAWQVFTVFPDTSILEAVKNVDGSGSGLDADLLDGNETTTSYYDNTNNSITKVGDFGIGTNGSVALPRPTDCDLAVISGIHVVSGTAANRPSGASTDAGLLIVGSWESNTTIKVQEFVSVVSGQSWKRVRNSSGSWLSWDRVVRDSDITSSNTDTTAGKLLKVGDFGVGGTVVLTETDLNAGSYLQSGLYLSPASGLTNLPAGYTQTGRVMVIVNGSSNSYVQQILTDDAGVTYTRYASVASIGSYSWKRIISDSDLTDVPNDTTLGKVLKVTDYGLGENKSRTSANLVTDLNNTIVTGLYEVNNSATPIPSDYYSSGKSSMIVTKEGGSGNRVNQLLIQGYNPDGKPRLWIRGQSTTEVWTSWARVWTDQNDGSGSGLDADTLDGNNSSYFLAASAYTAADVLAKLKTVDGAGSGLDADSVDGFQASEMRRVVAVKRSSSSYSGRLKIRLPWAANSGKMLRFSIQVYASYQTYEYEVSGYLSPYTNQWYLPKVTFKGSGVPDIKLGRDTDGRAYVSILSAYYYGISVSDLTLGFTASDTDLTNPNWSIAEDGTTPNTVAVTVDKVWTSGNHGSGSGLDADLLDGLHASSFTKTTDSIAWSRITGAPSAGVTDFNVIGSTAIAWNTTTTSYTAGSTIAGSNLRYSTNGSFPTFGKVTVGSSVFPTANTAALTGTWRTLCYVSGRTVLNFDYSWHPTLVVRVA